MLRSRRRRSEQPVDDSWPAAASATAPGAPAAAADPESEAILADSVGLALLVVLDRLTPAERLAFVLHDMFAMPFTDVAVVLGRSAEATRQLASRARRRVRGAPGPVQVADLARQRQVAAAFLAASRGGDLAALVAVLDGEVTLRADAGASPSGRPAALQGAQAVARGAVVAAGRSRYSELAVVDGAVGIVFAPGGHLQVVLALTVSDHQITAIDVIADPERLRRLELAVLPDEKSLAR
jgi:RNA polymerase sigma-70 factor (ECF subfamily)